jgi:hypothetical protein
VVPIALRSADDELTKRLNKRAKRETVEEQYAEQQQQQPQPQSQPQKNDDDVMPAEEGDDEEDWEEDEVVVRYRHCHTILRTPSDRVAQKCFLNCNAQQADEFQDDEDYIDGMGGAGDDDEGAVIS